MKGILLIIDGMGDLPIDALGHMTPLESAATPVLDQLASTGRHGLVDPTGRGKTPSTYLGAGVLLGAVPGQAKGMNRGPVEAAGLGLDLGQGEVALRANFATVTLQADGFVVVDRRAGRIVDGVEELAAVLKQVELGDGVVATLRPTQQHRAALILSGAGLDFAVSDTDPGDCEMPAPLSDCVATAPGAELAATMINRFLRAAHERLQDHPVNRSRVAAGLLPANGIITRGAGMAQQLDNTVRNAGLSSCVISGCNTVKGLGRLFGFDVVSDARFTGDLDTDLNAKIATAISQLEQHDLVFVHVKAPDICAHDRQPLVKRDFLERVDAALAPLLDSQIVVAVAADHTTNSNTGFHTADPIPALLNRPDNRHNNAHVKFGETACSNGDMQRQTGHQFVLETIKALRD